MTLHNTEGSELVRESTAEKRGTLGELVQLRVLRPDVLEKELGVQRLARHRHEELVRCGVERADGVDLRPEPVPQWCEVPGGDVRAEVRQVRLGGGEDLHRRHGAQRVGREVARQAGRPMHVLKTTLRVVFRLDPQVLLHLLVPDLRHVVDVDLAGDEALLNFEPQDDMQGVCHLVRLHADHGAALDDIDSRIQVLRALLRGEGSGEGLGQLRHEVAGEGPAEAHHALPEQGLALVHGHARRGAHRQAVVLDAAALLVEGVPGLVDRAGEALHDVLGLESRGHADVRWVSSAGERVYAHVQATLVEVKSQGQGNLLAEIRLLGRVELASQPGVVRRRPALPEVREEGHQAALHLAEDFLDPRRREPGRVVVGQDVVGGLGGVDELRPLPARGDPLLQDWGEVAPVLLLTSLHPGVVSAALELRLLPHKLLAHGGRLPVVASGLPHGSALVLVERRQVRALEPCQEAAKSAVGLLAVDDACQRPFLRGAGCNRSCRHHGHLVPAEEASNAAEGGDVLQLPGQDLVVLES
mmetsp:Transcript_93815/g.292355  ORF Transcript_93815/g.292355 Transcript_93815/m.292355 type:complete len:528 (+) Transcript_93815:16-1599(+)